jgi:arylsulfatase
MIVTDGGEGCGNGLYVVKGHPVFTYNLVGIQRFRWAAPQALAPGRHTIVFDFTYDGPGVAKGGTGVLKVDGAEVATRKIPRTIAFVMPIDETFDVGVDTRTGVNDADYHVPFRFTGTLHKVTLKHGPAQFTLDEHRMVAAAVARARD